MGTTCSHKAFCGRGLKEKEWWSRLKAIAGGTSMSSIPALIDSSGQEFSIPALIDSSGQEFSIPAPIDSSGQEFSTNLPAKGQLSWEILRE